MSTLDEKLEASPSSTGGNATATLTQLLKRWRVAGAEDGAVDPKKPPELIYVRSMSLETWKRLGPSSGGSTVYELLERLPLPESKP